jgi:EmrB/QacA subfamily drug resistance transporter
MVVAAGVLLTGLDLFIVNVALSRIAADLGTTDLADLSWVLNAYTIVFAALLVPAGRLGDRFGSTRVFLGGLVAFVLASAACALSPSLGWLVAFRVVQAVGAATMLPSSLGVLLAATPAERRGSAVRVWAGLGGLGAALGPVVGGPLVEAGWEWVFLVNVPIGLVTFVVGMRVLPALPGHGGVLPGLTHSLVLVASVAGLVTALVNAEHWGWGSGRTLAFLALAVVGGTLTWVMCFRDAAPILEPALLRLPGFTAAAGTLLVFHVAFGAMLLSVVWWLQQHWGWSALETGLGIAPGPLLVPVVATLSGRVAPSAAPAKVVALGGLVFAAGTAWWAVATGGEPVYAAEVLPGMVLTGIGVGLAVPSAMAFGTTHLPAERFSTGSAVLSMTRQIGIALGVAFFVAAAGGAGHEVSLAAFHRTWWLVAALAVASAVLAWRAARRSV